MVAGLRKFFRNSRSSKWINKRQICINADQISRDAAAPFLCRLYDVPRHLANSAEGSGDVSGVCHYLMDVRDKGLALARESGADVFIDVTRGKEKVAEEVQELTK